MYYLIEDDDLLEKYNTIWGKVSADTKKEFDNQPVYNKEFLKTKVKSLVTKLQNFTIKKFQMQTHTCLAVINLDYALKKNYSYYPQVFLKECKCIDKKIIRHINDNLNHFSYSSDEPDKEYLLS